MKKSVYAIMATLLLSATILGGCGQTGSSGSSTPNSGSASTTPTTQNADSTASGTSQKGDEDGDGIPDTVEKTYGTNPHTADTDGDGTNDKEDAQPVYTDNLISETSTTALPITITDSRVEDNATADHLEITFTNNGTTDLSNFDIYYTITDKVNTDQVEGYYQKLDGLTVKAGDSVTLHFDNDLTRANHYYGNMNGLYGTSANGLTFAVSLHASGYQPTTFNVEKADGTAEVAD